MSGAQSTASRRQSGNPALAGTLRDWSLVDVIQLIDLGKKTGAVVIHGRRNTDPIEGQIAFVEGTIYHAHNARLQGIEAVYDLFGATDGTFRFTNLDEVPPRNVYLSNEHVIIEGIARQDRASVAAPDAFDSMALRLVPFPNHNLSPIILTQQQWHLVALIQDNATVGTLAEHLHMPIAHVRLHLQELIALGLVTEQSTTNQ